MNQKEALHISGEIFGQIWTEKFGGNEMNAEECFRVARGCVILFIINCAASIVMWKMDMKIETVMMLTVTFLFISLVFIALNLDILLSPHWLQLSKDWAKVRWRMKNFYSSDSKFSKKRAVFRTLVVQEIYQAIDAEGVFRKRRR